MTVRMLGEWSLLAFIGELPGGALSSYRMYMLLNINAYVMVWLILESIT